MARKHSPPADVREAMLSSEHPHAGKPGMGCRGRGSAEQEGQLLAWKEGTTPEKVRKRSYKLSFLRSEEMPM